MGRLKKTGRMTNKHAKRNRYIDKKNSKAGRMDFFFLKTIGRYTRFTINGYTLLIETKEYLQK